MRCALAAIDRAAFSSCLLLSRLPPLMTYAESSLLMLCETVRCFWGHVPYTEGRLYERLDGGDGTWGSAQSGPRCDIVCDWRGPVALCGTRACRCKKRQAGPASGGRCREVQVYKGRGSASRRHSNDRHTNKDGRLIGASGFWIDDGKRVKSVRLKYRDRVSIKSNKDNEGQSRYCYSG